MINKGQIVEILATSPIYNSPDFKLLSKQEALIWKSKKKNYSLFDGILVGEHPGIENFKIGQRKGINVGGKKQALYVIEIDSDNNRLFVGAGLSHPGLWIVVLDYTTSDITWSEDVFISPKDLENGVDVNVKLNQSEDVSLAKLFIMEDKVYIELKKSTFITSIEHQLDIFIAQKKIAFINLNK